MLRYFVQRSQGEEFEEVKQPTSQVVWVVGEKVDREDISTIASIYQLDSNILDDVLDKGELSRTEYKDANEHIFLRVPRITKKGSVLSSPILAVLSDTRLVTLAREDYSLPLDMAMTHSGIHLSKKRTSVGLLLFTIVTLLTKYEELIKHTARVVKDTGQRLRTHEVTNHDFIHFVTVENNLNEYHINLSGMLDVCTRLHENAHQIFNEQDREALEDVMLHIRQLLVTVESSSKRVESIRNAYSTIANNTLNERMKLLTVFTVLIALPNVFYGMYGMNVGLPFQNAPWAYAAVMSFTIIVVILVYVIARRFKIF